MKSCVKKQKMHTNHTDLKSWLLMTPMQELAKKKEVDDVDNTQESLSQAQSVNSQQAPKSICSMLKA